MGGVPTQRGFFIRKPFRFLCVNMRPELLHRRCPGFHSRRSIHGGFTKLTSQCIPALCDGMARALLEAVRSQQRRDAETSLPGLGSERAVVNELLYSAPWAVRSSWAWKSPSHINLQEGAVWVRWLEET